VTLAACLPYTWTLDIKGSYTVIAKFDGSNSYYQTSAESSFAIIAAHPTATPQPTQAPSMSDLYFVPATAGLFVLVIVVDCTGSVDAQKTTIKTSNKNKVSPFLVFN